MKTYKLYSILQLLCAFCMYGVCTEENVQSKLQEFLKLYNASGTLRENDELLIALNKTRDKRALGLILSGLAEVFGYTLDPVRVASLPNPNPPTANGDSNQALVNVLQPSAAPINRQSPSNPPPSAPSSTASTTPAPRQRETIRFTGVVNFGNNSDLLNQLQRYERIFHGESTTQSPPMTSSVPSTTTTTSAPAALQDIRAILGDRPPLLTPFLVKIPLPIAPNLPPPIITSSNLRFSYPDVGIPVRKEQETVYRMNDNKETFKVEDTEIYDGKDVKIPPNKYSHDLYAGEPHWKKQHEDRIVELERKQQQYAEKLRQQEQERNREKDYDYSKERVEVKYKNQEEERGNRDEENDSNNKYKENDEKTYPEDYSGEEEENSGEKDDYRETTRPNSYTKESQEDEKEEAEKYREHENDNSYKEYENNNNSPPYVESNYTGIPYYQQLPISNYREKSKPETIRNSYGEIIDSRELIEDGIAGYFEQFKQPHVNFYDSQKIKNTENTSREPESEEPEEEVEDVEEVEEVEDEDGRSQQEYSRPSAENKYEEYDLEEREKETDRVDRRKSKTSKGVERKHTSQSEPFDNLEEEKSGEKFDFGKYTPYFVPARFLYAPDELQKAKARFTVSEKDDKPRSTPNITKKAKRKQERKPKQVDLKPNIGLPERLAPKRLHEGEAKEVQLWPAPFDYVFDGTEQATALPESTWKYRNLKQSSGYRKPDTMRIINKEFMPQQRTFVAPVDPVMQHELNVHPQNSYYNLNDGVNFGKQSLEQKLGNTNHPGNDENLTYNDPRGDNMKVNQHLHRERESEVPDILKRYNKGIIDRYQSNRQSDVELTTYVPSKQNIEIIAQPVSRSRVHVINYQMPTNLQKNYYNDEMSDSKMSPQEMVPVKTFNDPESAHDFFGLNKDDYSLDDKEGNKKSSGDDNTKKSSNEEEISGLIAPEPDPYYYDESPTKFTTQPETKSEKVKIKEYANKVATVTVSKQRQTSPNGPFRYVAFTRNL